MLHITGFVCLFLKIFLCSQGIWGAVRLLDKRNIGAHQSLGFCVSLFTEFFFINEKKKKCRFTEWADVVSQVREGFLVLN